MNNIQVLDCTLRDGGYCNGWRFGYNNIYAIIDALSVSGVDIIECGFITNNKEYDRDITQFDDIERISEFFPSDRDGRRYVAMINYGEYDIAELPVHNTGMIDGIRVAFHKRDMSGALEWCKEIKNKGYEVYLQPMVTLSYTDEEILELIGRANALHPYSFYIVDSFGCMKEKDLIRLYYMIDHNLSQDIRIGFHSHNNLQLAYSNAQRLTSIQGDRDIIIDSSVYGMGRGAGNLNTELFLSYLNDVNQTDYKISPLLNMIDNILNRFYEVNYWGYSLPNYVAAIHNAHPNYASYLDSKKTLTYEAMNSIFDMMSEDAKVSYDKSYIEILYEEYLEGSHTGKGDIEELKQALEGRTALIIAPGKSALREKEKISETALRDDVITISINHEPDSVPSDYIFVSNLRRFRELPKKYHSKCIVTSNITASDVLYQTDYGKLLNDIDMVRDNAGLMGIRFLMNLGVSTFLLAGFDGYSHSAEENYVSTDMIVRNNTDVLDAMNEGVSRVLTEYNGEVSISMLTTPGYVRIGV